VLNSLTRYKTDNMNNCHLVFSDDLDRVSSSVPSDNQGNVLGIDPDQAKCRQNQNFVHFAFEVTLISLRMENLLIKVKCLQKNVTSVHILNELQFPRQKVSLMPFSLFPLIILEELN
jgi:hypothetical protein